MAWFPVCQMAGRETTTKMCMLERSLFAVFVVATNALVVGNLGWAFFTTLWTSFTSIIPFLSLLSLASFLAFALLEDHLRGRRYGADGF